LKLTFLNDRILIKWLRVAHILLILFFAGAFPSWAATVQVEALRAVHDYTAGGSHLVRFRVQVAPSWYIHGAGLSHNGLISTRLSFADSPLFKVTDIQFPVPEKKDFPYAKEPIEVFQGEFEIRAQIVLSKDVPAGQQELIGTFSYQACSATSCLPPETVPVRLSLTVVPSGAGSDSGGLLLGSTGQKTAPADDPWSDSRAGAGLWLTLIGIFLGGLALNLTPCIYPLIPITVSYFGGKGRNTGGGVIIQGIVYICGLAVTNSILGVTASLSGAMLGSALQNPIVLITVAGILVGLATSFFGLWEIRVPSGLTRLASKDIGGYFGTFFMGLTLGIVAAPCLGPFILGLLTYVGQKGDPFLGFLYFFVLSIGMGLPLAVLAMFSGALERLPMSGGWMEWVRKILGWVLVGMAGYLVQPLIPDPVARIILFSAIAVAAGVHLGWLDRTRHRSPHFSKVKKALGAVLIAGAVAFFLLTPRHLEGIQWIPYAKGMLADAARDNRPVIMDFYADWCGPCKAMERNVFTAPEIVELSNRFLPIRVDLTQRHPDQDVLLKRYQIRGVPAVLFLNGRGVEEKGLRIESYAGIDDVSKRMKQAANLASK
jgi:thioredoxin:protein disulfide reductase